MRLRTKLVNSLFALAIVPLAAIVVYSYLTSIDAFRQAVEAEGRQMAEGMNLRMAAVREDLDRFLGRATRLGMPALEVTEAALGRDAETRTRLPEDRTELAALVEACEFIPAVPGAAVPGSGDESEPVEPPAAPAAPEERFVFRFAPPQPEELPDDPPSRPFPDHDTQRISDLIAEGSRIVAMVIEDPEAFEEELNERGGEITSEVIGVVLSEGSHLVARAMENPEGFEQEMATYGEHLKQRVLAAIPARLRLTEAELAELEARRAKAEALLGRRYSYEIRDGNRVVGTMRAQVSAPEVLAAVLAAARRSEGEVPFAVDAGGMLHTLNAEDGKVLEELGIARAGGAGPEKEPRGWIVVETEDPVSGTSFGIARPLGEGLAAIRRTAVRNMALGLLVVALAGWGVLPLTSRMTRNLSTVTAAANALARGDLSTRAQVRSRDEIGQLAAAFNRMASDLDDHQKRLLEEERLRREQEVETRLLEVEHQRQRDELEAARRFQLSLLPDRLPRHPAYQIAVAMRTATEVGGDYYDFQEQDDGGLTVALGDATGHGAAAGTMVTVAKSLFTAATDLTPASFLEPASAVIRTMRLGRMNMALALARLDSNGLTASMAGMPPLLVHRRASGTVEEVVIPGLPLGGLSASTYREARVPLAAGDTVLMMSDGFPELLDEDGEPLGYERARAEFAAAAAEAPERLIATLEERATAWRGARAQADDISFVVLRKD